MSFDEVKTHVTNHTHRRNKHVCELLRTVLDVEFTMGDIARVATMRGLARRRMHRATARPGKVASDIMSWRTVGYNGDQMATEIGRAHV